MSFWPTSYKENKISPSFQFEKMIILPAQDGKLKLFYVAGLYAMLLSQCTRKMMRVRVIIIEALV